MRPHAQKTSVGLPSGRVARDGIRGGNPTTASVGLAATFAFKRKLALGRESGLFKIEHRPS